MIDRTILAKLCHFDPYLEDEMDFQILESFLLQTFNTLGPMIYHSPSELVEALKRNYKIQFEESEIVHACEKLVKKDILGKDEPSSRKEPPRFRIYNHQSSEIDNEIQKFKKLEENVVEKWTNEVKQKYTTYNPIQNNLNLLIESLHKFLSKIFTDHGLESISILYPKMRGKFSKNKINLDDFYSDKLHEDEVLSDVIKNEISNFLKHPDEERKNYLTSLFNSSFLWHLIQVDDFTSELFAKVTSKQMLFLDANILYSLVGFSGAYQQKSIVRMLGFAKKLDYELYVTTKTIDEFHYSINNKISEDTLNYKTPKQLVDVALEVLDEDSFVVSYWSEYSKNGISLEEFAAEKSHIESLLEKFNINLYKEYREEIEGSEELLDEMSTLRSACGNWLNENIVEHDAFHRILINKIRGRARYKFHNAKAWFLTSDSKLLTYSKVARKNSGYLPFCVTSDQWIQINRPLLARTGNNKFEIEESFYALVSQPYIRAITSRLKIQETYQKVIFQLSKYETMNPEFAFDIITDTHFILSLSKCSQVEIAEKLDSQYLNLAETLSEKNKKLESEKENQKKEINRLSHTKETLEEDLQSRKEHEILLDSSLKKMGERLDEIETSYSSLQTKYDDTSNELIEKEGFLNSIFHSNNNLNFLIITLINFFLFYFILFDENFSLFIESISTTELDFKKLNWIKAISLFSLSPLTLLKILSKNRKFLITTSITFFIVLISLLVI